MSSANETFGVNSHSSYILSKLNEQRLDGKFCDVILQVESKKFSAHRNVLAACSEYFFKMFMIEMKERYEKVVTIKEISPDAMKILLDFLYTNTISLCENNVAVILQAASMMQINLALDVIASYLMKNLDSKNCLRVRKLGQMHNMPQLVAEADQCIINNFEEVTNQVEYFDMTADDVVKLLLSDDLKVKEETTVFETIEKWVSKDVNQRKRHFPDLFGALRLQYIPMKELAEKIRKHQLVREFLDCRDLVEDAFFFHVNSEMVTADKPRKNYEPKAHSLLCINESNGTAIFNVSKRSWIKQDFKGWKRNVFKQNCAVATKLPSTVFCGGKGSASIACADVVIFDGKSFDNLPSMKVARSGAAAVYHANELFVFGGEKVDVPTLTYSNSMYSGTRTIDDFADNFEIFLKSWKIAGKLRSRRSFAGAHALEGKIYLIGGYQFQPQNIPAAAVSQQCGSAAAFQNQTSLMQEFRRPYEQNRTQVVPKEVCASCDVYKVDEGVWEKGPKLNTPRANFASATVGSTIFVCGGTGTQGVVLNNVESLDLSRAVWTVIKSGFGKPKCAFISAAFVKQRIFMSHYGSHQLISFDPKNHHWSIEPAMPGYLISYICPIASQVKV